MEPAMTMLLVSLVTWIIWSHCCCWNCIIAISIRRQLHRPHHRHLASNFCWVRIFLISFMNGVKQPKGKIRTRFCSDVCPKVMKLSSFVTFISMVSEIIAINWKKNFHYICRYSDAVRLEQLKLYEQLVTHSRHQLLLVHESFLRPLLKILTSSLGVKYPTDVEKRLVILLNQLCVVLMQNVNLLDLFFCSTSQHQQENDETK